ncbi:MAG: phosphoethanolamine transferase [Sediminibacterium sp.]|nr:phosphoethanolamine transferase [Sediminibacterium sp.]
MNSVKSLAMQMGKYVPSLFKTLLFTAFVFIVSSFTLFLSFILKKLNPSEYGLIQGTKHDLEITYKEILFFCSIVLAFFLISVSYRYIKTRWIKNSLIGIVVLYLIVASFLILADVVNYLIFAYPLTFAAVQTVLNTNPDEAGEFAKLYLSTGNIMALISFLGILLFVFYKRHAFIRFFTGSSFFYVSMGVSVFGVLDFIQLSHSKGNGTHNVRYWDILIGEYNEYKAFNRKLAAEKNVLALSGEYSHFYKTDTLPKTVVLVVSESLSKRHMSLYGYPRSTTPGLDTNTSIYPFNNWVTMAALTAEAVPSLFYNGYLSQKVNLLALLNKLNYDTYWLSNQSGWGKTDATIVLLSQLCKKSAFMDSLNDDSKSNSSLHLDEAILKSFDETLQRTPQKSRFIVVHLMGCHFDYEKRYPAARNYFTGESPAKVAVKTPKTRQLLNAYDNAMRYHDSVVNTLITIFNQRCHNQNAALLFLSDHGEELFENRDYAGHCYPPDKCMAEIPAFAVLSPAYKKQYPLMEEIIRKRKTTPFSSSNAFFSLLHLAGVHSKKHEQHIRHQSFFSAAYDSTKPRYIMGFDYSKMTY